MFDVDYQLLKNATSGSTLKRTWMSHKDQVFMIYVASGTPTVTLQGCDTENGTFETIGTKACQAGRNYWRVVVPYKYIKATATAACTMGIVPAGQFNEPA